MKIRRALALCLLPFLAGCQTVEEVFTPEVCNDMFQGTLDQIAGHKKTIDSIRKTMEAAERSGDTASVEANRKSLESYKTNGVGGNIKYIEEQLLKNCKNTFSPALMQGLEDARKILDESEESFKEEGMPDVRIGSIESTFIPYELDERGQCSGPFLDLMITVVNNGADFPRPVDLETYSERAQQPPEELPVFNVVAELDFGNDMRKRLDFEVWSGPATDEKTERINGGLLKAGGSIKIPAKVRLDYNQTHAKASAYVVAHAFLENGNDQLKTETDIDVPIWDIYTVSHQAVASKDSEDGKTYFGAIATVTNKGKSPTPGPISGSFILWDTETGRKIIGWSGKTSGPVSGEEKIYVKEPFSGTLPKSIRVESSIIPLCPNGEAGSLADGNTKDNIRELRMAGDAGASSAASN